jgi:TolB-like protein
MADTSRAIFLSYSSQDAEAVRRICVALRAAGLEVWFDQSELRGGDAWDASIRRQIRDCALFVPVISGRTEERGEGYFRLEWRLAVERSHLMADDQAFLMPVVIDATSEATARVPDRFRERQWTRLPGGETPQAFIEQVRHALAAAAVRPAPAIAPHPVAAKAIPAPRRHWRIAAILAAVAAAALAAGLIARNGHKAGAAPAKQAAKTAPTFAPAAADPKSIAVLPFANLTGRPEDAYLADGLQEEILNALARLPDLKVISRTSASEFRGSTPNVREVGQRLGVSSVLEGSVRREGQKLRLTVQLIDTRNDQHILAADYDRDLGHVLGLQSEVARKVAAALAATLGNYERGQLERVATNNGDAYNFYLRAAALWRQSTPEDDLGIVEPRRQLEQALRLDPDYTDALALLSQACTWLFFNLRHEADGACAKKNYERALALDARLPEARLARGLYEMYVASDLEQAFIDLDAVVRQRPNAAEAHSVLGFALRRRGRFDEALTHFTRAWDLDPLNHAYDGGAFVTLMGLRRLPELIEQTRIYAQRFPADPTVYITRGWIESLMQHSLEPVRQALRDHGGALPATDRKNEEAALLRAEGRYVDAAKLLESLPYEIASNRHLRLGFLYWAGGKPAEAERLFRTVEQEASSLLRREPHSQDMRTRLALAQSMLGEHAAALTTIDAERAEMPEARDPVNGPAVSFMRSIILVRAGRGAEGYAEVTRLLRVPFGVPIDIFSDGDGEILLLVKSDPHYDELVNHPPRL